MIVIYNPFACEGRAWEKFRKVQPLLKSKAPSFRLIPLQRIESLNGRLQEWIHQCHHQVVAVGGDGTVNGVVNFLIKNLNWSELKNLKLGAIGLGSSNDFHKPLTPRRIFRGIPVTLDFQETILRDIVLTEYITPEGYRRERYFLLNASCGITADANYRFNHPTRVLHILKRKSTSLAILHAALTTILNFTMRWVEIQSDRSPAKTLQISNIAIVKNPYCSGNFRYDSPYEPQSGRMWVHICRGMSRTQLLKVLWSLSHHRFTGLPGTESWEAEQVTIRSRKPFALEMDGEVVLATEATFRVIPRLLQVCQQ